MSKSASFFCLNKKKKIFYLNNFCRCRNGCCFGMRHVGGTNNDGRNIIEFVTIFSLAICKVSCKHGTLLSGICWNWYLKNGIEKTFNSLAYNIIMCIIFFLYLCIHIVYKTISFWYICYTSIYIFFYDFSNSSVTLDLKEKLFSSSEWSFVLRLCFYVWGI